MASQFPGQQIQYTDVSPSGRIAAVPAQMPATGGLEAVGGALFQLGQKIDAQESAVELSQGKRQIEEKGYAVFNSLTADPEANEKAWQKYEQEVSGIVGQSKRGNVQRALQIHVNDQIPQWREAFDKRGLAIRKQNAADQFKFEYTTLLGRGDVGGAAQILETAKATDIMSQAEYDHYATNIFTDSALEMANVDIREGRIKQGIDNLSSLKGLNTDQLEIRDKTLALAKKNLEASSSESNKQLTDLMIGGKLSPVEVTARRQTLDDTSYQQWAKISLNPPDKKGNRIKEAELKSRAMDVWRGTISRTDAESQMRNSLAEPNGINDEQYASISGDLDREVKGMQAADTHSYSIQATQLILGKDSGAVQFDAQGNMTFNMQAVLSPAGEFERKLHFVSLYNRDMMDYLADNPKASKKELFVHSEEAKQSYLDMSKGSAKEISLSGNKQPTADELRRQNTKAAYEQGITLGYWR